MNLPRRQRGLALVEFAITVPVFLLLLLATAEITRAFTHYSLLAHSVRDSVRHLAGRALLGTTGIVSVTAQLAAESRNLVVFGNTAGTGAPLLPGLAPGQVTVVDAGGGEVRVQVVYPYQSVLGGTLPGFGFGAARNTNFTLTVANTMRAL